MPPRNPSELTRLEAELEFCRDSLKNGYHSKATKEYLLSEIRRLEATLGLESAPYNSNDF